MCPTGLVGAWSGMFWGGCGRAILTEWESNRVLFAPIREILGNFLDHILYTFPPIFGIFRGVALCF